MSRVEPSGAERAATSLPMIEFAPGLLSTITGAPLVAAICAATRRARTSAVPPAGKVTITFMSRGGSCAPAAKGRTMADNMAIRRRRIAFSPLPEP